MVMAAPPSAWSWGNQGHEAVAYVAWQQLSQPVKDKVFALLKQVPSRATPAGKKAIPGFKEWSQGLPDGLTPDLQHMYISMRAATWPDSIKHAGLHDSDTPPANKTEAAANLGFTDPDSHGYWRFVDTPIGTAATRGSTPPSVPKSCWIRKKGQAQVPPTPVQSIPKAPVPDAATEITLLSGFLISKESSLLQAYDMIWLEHLVGDIHQPLLSAIGGIRPFGTLASIRDKGRSHAGKDFSKTFALDCNIQAQTFTI
jgi:hypothetical protein